MSGYWRKRRSRPCARALGVSETLVLLAIALLTLSGLPALGHGPAAAATGTPVATSADSGELSGAPSAVAGTQLSLAVESLESGSAVSSGASLRCTQVDGGASYSCVSAARGSEGTLSSGPDSGGTPPAAYGSAMTYDSRDGYVLLFGGSSGPATWTFDHGAWTEIFPSMAPERRTGTNMVFDAADNEVILFGGENAAGGATYLTTTYYNDTWAFSAGTWTNLTHANDAPSERYDTMMAYDAADGYVVLFGGDYERNFLNDTWTFHGGTWTNVSGSSPAASTPSCRFGGSMTFDAGSGYVLLFGGVGKAPGEGCGESARNGSAPGTWTFSGGTWKNLSIPAADSPENRWGAGMAYDAADGYVVLFGGIGNNDVALDDTWEFSDGTWTQLNPALYPISRFSGVMTYDASDSYVVLFGGLSEPQHDAPELGDVWVFSHGLWDNLTAIPSPSSASGFVMTYDARDGYVLLFGGEGPSGPLADTWRFAGEAWLQLTPPESPPARYGAAMTFDAQDNYVLLFGGKSGASLLNDTWQYNRGNWTEVGGAGLYAPPARDNASMAYDATEKFVLLFGGNGANGPLGDTWKYKGGNWTQLVPSNSPPARSGAALAYNPSTKSDLLFGGLGGGGYLQDTWTFASGRWTQDSPSASPSARAGAGLAYDSADGYLLLFGGRGSGGTLDDTWAYGANGWASLQPPGAPSARSSAGLAFDGVDNVSVLFGGTGAGGSLADTWQYSNGSWVEVLPARYVPVAPPPTTTHSSSGGTGLNAFDWELGIVLVVAAVVIALAVWRLRRRKSTPSGGATSSAGAPETPAPTGPGVPESSGGTEGADGVNTPPS